VALRDRHRRKQREQQEQAQQQQEQEQTVKADKEEAEQAQPGNHEAAERVLKRPAAAYRVSKRPAGDTCVGEQRRLCDREYGAPCGSPGTSNKRQADIADYVVRRSLKSKPAEADVTLSCAY